MRGMSHHQPISTPRPWTRWGFSLALALTGVYNLLLALDNARHAGTYRALDVSYPPLLRTALALGWGAAFVLLGVALARRNRWVWRWGWLLVCNYGAFSVLWMIVFAESDYSRGRIGFHAVLTAILVGLAVWIMRWRRVRGVSPRHAGPAANQTVRPLVEQPVSNAGEFAYEQQQSQD